MYIEQRDPRLNQHQTWSSWIWSTLSLKREQTIHSRQRTRSTVWRKLHFESAVSSLPWSKTGPSIAIVEQLVPWFIHSSHGASPNSRPVPQIGDRVVRGGMEDPTLTRARHCDGVEGTCIDPGGWWCPLGYSPILRPHYRRRISFFTGHYRPSKLVVWSKLFCMQNMWLVDDAPVEGCDVRREILLSTGNCSITEFTQVRMLVGGWPRLRTEFFC